MSIDLQEDSTAGMKHQNGFDIKKLSWIPICGFAVGFCSRKIYETAYQFTTMDDYSLFDLEAITYGIIFMILAGIFTGILFYNESKFGRFAKFKYSIASRSNHPRINALFVTAKIYALTLRQSFLLYFLAGLSVLMVTDNLLLSGLSIVAISLFWPVVAFGAKDSTNKSINSAEQVYQFLDLASIQGAIISILAIFAVYFGYAIIKNVPLSLGGAKPQIVTIHLRQTVYDDSLPIYKLNHKPILLLYKQGSTLWIKGIKDSIKYSINKTDIGIIETPYRSQ